MIFTLSSLTKPSAAARTGIPALWLHWRDVRYIRVSRCRISGIESWKCGQLVAVNEVCRVIWWPRGDWGRVMVRYHGQGSCHWGVCVAVGHCDTPRWQNLVNYVAIGKNYSSRIFKDPGQVGSFVVVLWGGGGRWGGRGLMLHAGWRWGWFHSAANHTGWH